MEIAQAIAPESKGPTITAGEILVEIMATSIGEGFVEPLSLVGPFASGAPAIFIDQIARMGCGAGIISAVGQDDFGRLNVDRLQNDGADVSAIQMLPDYPTGSAFVRYRADGQRDFVFNIARSAAGQIELNSAAEQLIDRAGHVHVMGSAFSIPGIADIIMRAITLVKARGGSVSFDPNVRKELLASGDDARRQLEEILAVTDLLLPSGEELYVASGIEDEAGAVATLLSRGVSEIVLKRGAQGSSCFHRAGRIDSPAFVVEEVDPTGAGDCFGAAYLSCRRLGLSIAESLQYANAAGARTVTVRGPMEGASTFEQLDDFIRNNRTET